MLSELNLGRSSMAFNIRQYLGITGTNSTINHDNVANPLPEDLLDRLDRDINDLIARITGAKTPALGQVSFCDS